MSFHWLVMGSTATVPKHNWSSPSTNMGRPLGARLVGRDVILVVGSTSRAQLVVPIYGKNQLCSAG